VIELIIGLVVALALFFVLLIRSIRNNAILKARVNRAEIALSIIKEAQKRTEGLIARQNEVRNKKNSVIAKRNYFSKLLK
jgi:hypothetical protein